MSTRRLGISPEHVNALNLVEVDFYGEPAVQEAWKAYLAHLNSSIDPAKNYLWGENKEKLLASLLSAIASVLRLDVPAIEIFRGGYAPVGWEQREQLGQTALNYIKDLHDGTRGIKVLLVPPKSDAESKSDAELG